MNFILVTGCNGGMGKAICKILQTQGFGVIGIDKLQDKENTFCTQLQCDITNKEAVKALYSQIHSLTSSLYGIVHTSGIYDMNSLIEIEESQLETIFQVNVFGVYRINKYLLPLLRKKSKIIIISSELAPLDPLPFTGLYGITKTTLEKYAFSLQMELQLQEITVCLIRPGAVKTSLLSVSTKALNNFVENTKLYTCNATNFKKIVDSVETRNIKPEQIAKKVLLILSKKHPRFVYNINRNPLLRLLNILPKKLQFFLIKQILKP